MTTIPVGIDLGTTYSSITFYDETRNQPEVIKLSQPNNYMPSYVQLKSNRRTGDMNFLVGKAAKDSSSVYTLFDSKRLIGKTYEEYEQMGNETKYWTFGIENENNFVKMSIPHPLDKEKRESFYPEEVSAVVLNELLKSFYAQFSTSKIGQVVVTIPADFKLDQREGTMRACTMAGLKDVTFINEPSASIIEYARNFPFASEMKILVIDFGGGTLDISYCKADNTNVDVIASGGDQDLGGNNFDRIIFDLILEKMEEEGISEDLIDTFKKNENDTKKMLEKKERSIFNLRKLSEETKEYLSIHNEKSIYLADKFGDDYDGYEIYLTRKDFEDKIKESEIIKRFKKCINEIFESNNLTITNVDLILPIGGSCSIPLIKETLISMFPNTKVGDDRFDTLTAVAKGAATRAYQLQSNNGTIFKDVLPYSIGIPVSKNGFRDWVDLIGKKNQPLPIHCVKKYFNPQDNMPYISLKIFMGEKERTSMEGMKQIEGMRIILPPHLKAKTFKIEVHFDVNESGLMRVKVINRLTKEELGEMDIKLESSKLNERIPFMIQHLETFGFNIH